MRVPGCGCNVSTMVLGSVVETCRQILILYTLWFWGCNSGGNSSGPLMGPGTTRLAHVLGFIQLAYWRNGVMAYWRTGVEDVQE
jgi:hypothetical protein